VRIGVSIVCLIAACSFTPGAAALQPDAYTITIGGDAPRNTDGHTGTSDAPIDAVPSVTMTETTNETIAVGDSVYCKNTQTTRDNAWFRAFQLSDWGVTGTLHVNTVHFTSESASGAGAIVTIYEYDGTYGGTTLPLANFTSTAGSAATPDFNNSAPYSDIDTAITADVTGTIVVGIVEDDTLNDEGTLVTWFHLGANNNGQTEPSYYASMACGEDTISAQANTNFIIDVTGTY
jgi:hypothetical protein